jgi:hypothetical protein
MPDNHETPRDESDVGEPPYIPPGEDPDESESDDSEPTPSDPEPDS